MITTIALGFYSIPTFLVGQLVLFHQLYLAGYELFFRARTSHSGEPAAVGAFLILPWASIALVSAATYSRLTRGAMLDVLHEDYIRRRARSVSPSTG